VRRGRRDRRRAGGRSRRVVVEAQGRRQLSVHLENNVVIRVTRLCEFLPIL
jgi:hypothetical protein